MSLLHKVRTLLQDDPLFRRVLRNSSYLFGSNTVSAALGVLQGILVVRLLGDSGYGLLAIVMDFASNTNRLLSFRMSEVVVKFMGEALAQENRGRAAAVVKGIGLLEAGTSLLAYLALLTLSAWAARTFAHDAGAVGLIRFYGLFLLANLVYETCVGVLQTTGQFRQVARANLLQSVAITVSVAAAFALGLGIAGILAAYLIGKAVAGVTISLAAVRELNRALGSGWSGASLRLVPDWKPIVRFAFSTNLNGTVNLFARDNIRLYLAWFLSNAQVGYFKLASSLINLVMLPIEPLIWPTYAEITRTIAQRQWGTTRRLLRQISTIGGLWTLLAGGGLVALGWWLIPLIYGSEMSPVYPGVVVLLAGYAFANVLNWNRPLLLALGQPAYPLLVAAICGLIEVLLILLFVPGNGYLAGTAIFAAYLAVSVSWNALQGLSILRQAETAV